MTGMEFEVASDSESDGSDVEKDKKGHKLSKGKGRAGKLE